MDRSRSSLSFGKHLTLLGVLAALSGCAASSTFSYTESPPVEVENAVLIGRGFDPTWDILVKNLAAEFFVINNIDKESRIINVSFSTNDPGQFMNCGRSARSFTGGAGKSVSYNYAVTDDVEYYSADDQGRAWSVRRETELNGRANIYLAPEGENTRMTVNVRYIMNVDVAAYFLSAAGLPVGPPDRRDWSLVFETKNPLKATGDDPACHSLGTLEQRIMQAAQPSGT